MEKMGPTELSKKNVEARGNKHCPLDGRKNVQTKIPVYL